MGRAASDRGHLDRLATGGAGIGRLDQSAKLTFEVSDGVRPMQLYRAALPEISDGAIHIELSPRPASCKPRDRWLVEQQKQVSCCDTASAEPCCSS